MCISEKTCVSILFISFHSFKIYLKKKKQTFFILLFRSTSSDLRSQTPSPHFGQLTMNVPKNEYRTLSSSYLFLKKNKAINRATKMI